MTYATYLAVVSGIRRLLLPLALVVSLGVPTVAQAGDLKPISMAAGCRNADRGLVAYWRKEYARDALDFERDGRCYRRDRYRIVRDATIWYPRGDYCAIRSIGSQDDGGWRYHTFATYCS